MAHAAAAAFRSCALVGILGLIGFAQVSEPVDPPGRVARVSFISGNTSVLSQATGPDWVPAQLNYPVTSGDQIWTDFDSRAELHLGTASIRMRDQTNASITVLDDMFVQVRLNAGGLNIHVRHLMEREMFEIDTPNAALTILKAGDYRIDVSGQQTRVIVHSGIAELAGTDRSLPLRERDLVEVSGFGQLSYNLMIAPREPDEFDRWAMDRNRKEAHFESARYVSPDVIGAQDLDLYGSWSEVPDLGPVWRPTTVDPGWVPYQDGHWVWVDPWGWTWVDDSPWGFAPFHYGRWAQVGGMWVWVPGPMGPRPVYSPALVVWVGGPGFQVGGVSGLAWFALGPGEVFVPWYRTSPRYVTNVNAANTRVSRAVLLGNVPYANRNGAVGMSHADLASGRPVRGVVRRVSPAAMSSAQVSTVASPAVRPALPAARGAVSRPPPDLAARPVIVRRNAAPAPRISAPAPAATRTVAPSQPVPVVAGPPTGGERVDGPVRVRRPPATAAPPVVNTEQPRAPERAIVPNPAPNPAPERRVRVDAPTTPQPVPRIEPRRAPDPAVAPPPPPRPEPHRSEDKKKDEKKEDKKQ